MTTRLFLGNPPTVVEASALLAGSGALSATAQTALHLEQLRFRFRSDADAVDATPTWSAGENVSVNPAVNTPFRLRFKIRNHAAVSQEVKTPKLYVSKNGGAYQQVTATSNFGIKSADASASADGAQIFAPRLSFGYGAPFIPAVYFDGETYQDITLAAGSGGYHLTMFAFFHGRWVYPGPGRERQQASFFQFDRQGSGSGGTTFWVNRRYWPGAFEIYAENFAADGYVQYHTENYTVSQYEWHSALVHIDTSQAVLGIQAYLDDAPLSLHSQIIYGPALPWPMAHFNSGDKFSTPDWFTNYIPPPVGSMARFWLSSQNVDLSVEGNRRKFITANNNPVPLGDNGELPTGVAPEVYFSGNATDYLTNRGTCGAFTLHGTLKDATTSPGFEEVA